MEPLFWDCDPIPRWVGLILDILPGIAAGLLTFAVSLYLIIASSEPKG